MSLGMFATHPTNRPPHPPISPAVYLVIEDAIRIAWVKIRNMHRDQFDIDSADEDEITQKLHEVLLDEIYDSGQVEGFDSTLISKGTREEKIRNFNGQHLDKMPDMVFGIIGRRVFMRTQDGIFVECKPVDASHTAGVHYCDKGIVRFVNGDYAWYMVSALMVGYAAPGYTVSSKLEDALTKSCSIVTSSGPVADSGKGVMVFSQQTYTTVHQRNFTYLETGLPAPSIHLRHLWLARN